MQLLQLVRRALRVATGRHDDRLRVAAPGRPEELPGLGISGRRHGAGVQNDDVGRGRCIDDSEPGLPELASQRLTVCLVQLAAVGVDCDRSLPLR